MSDALARADKPNACRGVSWKRLTPLQASTRQRYSDYAAGRYERTLSPQGERRTLFARDLVGTSEQILARLLADPVLPHVRELRLELPYEFEHDEYRQILHDFVMHIAPELGWNKKTPLRAAS